MSLPPSWSASELGDEEEDPNFQPSPFFDPESWTPEQRAAHEEAKGRLPQSVRDQIDDRS